MHARAPGNDECGEGNSALRQRRCWTDQREQEPEGGETEPCERIADAKQSLHWRWCEQLTRELNASFSKWSFTQQLSLSRSVRMLQHTSGTHLQTRIMRCNQECDAARCKIRQERVHARRRLVIETECWLIRNQQVRFSGGRHHKRQATPLTI